MAASEVPFTIASAGATSALRLLPRRNRRPDSQDDFLLADVVSVLSHVQDFPAYENPEAATIDGYSVPLHPEPPKFDPDTELPDLLETLKAQGLEDLYWEDAFSLDPSAPAYRIETHTDEEGKISWEEKEIPEEERVNSDNAMSLLRPMGSRSDFVRGTVNNAPFMPGGIELDDRLEEKEEHERRKRASVVFKTPEEIRNFLTYALKGTDSVPPETQKQIEQKLLSKLKMSGINRGIESSISPTDISKTEDVTKLEDDPYFAESPVAKKPAKQLETAKQFIMNYEDILNDPYFTVVYDEKVELEETTKGAKVDLVSEKKIEFESKESEEAFKFAEEITKGTEESIPKPEPGTQEVWGIQEPLKTFEEATAEFVAAVPTPAISYPFELDPFQKQAVIHLERGESVFVAAHTSAGKTVVAEYAIALASRHLTRAVYTSPIKTLSNQKYREFRKTFGDGAVGLITGDVSVNPEAPCVILTTEILRSMLYRGADLIRDIEWAIFDEVHYVTDPERGVVWEEVLIMLPEHVGIVLLSATVPNPAEFAEWVGRIKKRKVFVISTFKRPVPLQHYLWIGGAGGEATKDLFLVVNSTGEFQRQAFENARQAMIPEKVKAKEKETGKKAPKSTAPAKKVSEKYGWVTLIHFLEKRTLLPVVVFSLSKKRCEMAASGLTSLDLCTASEKSDIHIMIENALKRLHGSDRELPQILKVSEMLKRGIGIHHSGVLPLVKELVEMVFQRGLIKVLFATETFAMGVNMPTKTVVFNGLRKFDGVNFRQLLPGEYTQMAGRAGRRGLDSFGVVVINCPGGELPREDLVQQMILGKPTRLESRFRLTFNMILNLLRVGGDLRVKDLIKRSFAEAASLKAEPARKDLLKKDVEKLKMAQSAADDIECVYQKPMLIRDYYDNYHRWRDLNSELLRTIISTGSGSKLLTPGRVVSISKAGLWECPACFVSSWNTEWRLFQVVIACPMGWKPSRATLGAMKSDVVENVWLESESLWVTSARPRDIVSVMNTSIPGVAASAYDVHSIGSHLRKMETSGDPPQPLDFLEDLGLKDPRMLESYEEAGKRWESVESSPCHSCPMFEAHFGVAEQEFLLKERVNALKNILDESNADMMEELRQRLRVLDKLGYVSPTGGSKEGEEDEPTVLLKGRVACEINTCESLIVTEMLFDNFFGSITPEEACAMLSCLVFQQKTSEDDRIFGGDEESGDGESKTSAVEAKSAEVKPMAEKAQKTTSSGGLLTPGLLKAREKLFEVCGKIAKVQAECGMVGSTAQNFLEQNVKFGLLEVVYEWARGTDFGKICAMTEVEEGSIVRCITRLYETCKDVRNAARVVGDGELYRMMEKAATLIKRDIVFASSLYVA